MKFKYVLSISDVNVASKLKCVVTIKYIGFINLV